MSHTVQVEIELSDKAALTIACEKLGLNMSEEGSHKLYNSTEEGVAVTLPGWKYPAIVHADGSVAIDNYEGSWGDIKELNKLKQRYGAEKAAKEARMNGYSVFENIQANGDIELTMDNGGEG